MAVNFGLDGISTQNSELVTEIATVRNMMQLMPTVAKVLTIIFIRYTSIYRHTQCLNLRFRQDSIIDE